MLFMGINRSKRFFLGPKIFTKVWYQLYVLLDCSALVSCLKIRLEAKSPIWFDLKGFTAAVLKFLVSFVFLVLSFGNNVILPDLQWTFQPYTKKWDSRNVSALWQTAVPPVVKFTVAPIFSPISDQGPEFLPHLKKLIWPPVPWIYAQSIFLLYFWAHWSTYY